MFEQEKISPKSWFSGTLIVAASVFMALFSNVAFFKATANTFGNATHGLPFTASLLLIMTSVFVLLLSAVCHRKLVKPVIIFILLLSSVLARPSQDR